MILTKKGQNICDTASLKGLTEGHTIWFLCWRWTKFIIETTSWTVFGRNCASTNPNLGHIVMEHKTRKTLLGAIARGITISNLEVCHCH